jgi:micrococcal nuclease
MPPRSPTSPHPFRRILAVTALVAIGLVVLSGCGRHYPDPLSLGYPHTLLHRTPTTYTQGVVTAHVDGDTLKVNGVRIRIIGVDTPETVKPDTPVQCYGPQASAATDALLPVGTKVDLEFDDEHMDKYGRTLAYVYRARDGLFLEGWLAYEGYARQLTIAPNTKHEGELASLTAQAHRARRGLWGDC